MGQDIPYMCKAAMVNGAADGAFEDRNLKEVCHRIVLKCQTLNLHSSEKNEIPR